MAYAEFFSPDYRRARERFVGAATESGMRLESHPIDAEGPSGERLEIDAAFLGTARPSRVVIVSSGLHGIEGYFGSAVQLGWLARCAKRLRLPPDGALIFLHGLNPFGIAWRRRWNENNVDLNRNFVADWSFLRDDPAYAESRRVYEALRSFLNPESAPSRYRPSVLNAIRTILLQGYAARKRLPAQARPALLDLKSIRELGIEELKKTLPVGQYEYEDGLFFGGNRVECTTALLQARMPTWVCSADTIFHIDLHTGLGAWGGYKLFVEAEQGSEDARTLSARFGASCLEPSDSPAGYRAQGLMTAYFRQKFAGRKYYGITAEFGTYPLLRVFCALRAEHRAHRHARPGADNYEWAKRELMEVFSPSSPAWREAAVAQGLDIIERSLSACFQRPLQRP